MVLGYWETRRPAHLDSEFDRLVNRAFGDTGRAGVTTLPAADVVVDGGDVVISVDLPGLAPEDIDIEVAERRLSISGERKSDEVGENGRVLSRRRRSGAFRSDFRLPAGVTAEQVSAGYEHGVLTVRVSGVTKPKQDPVKVQVAAGPAAGAPAIESE